MKLTDSEVQTVLDALEFRAENWEKRTVSALERRSSDLPTEAANLEKLAAYCRNRAHECRALVSKLCGH